MFPNTIMKNPAIASLLATAGFVATSPASTLLLSDSFNDNNSGVSGFNNNLALTQSGTLATTTYSLQGGNYVVQHGNGGTVGVSGVLLVATSTDGNGNGSVSLNNNFATQANATNEALQITFNIDSVDSYPSTDRWVQFNIGDSQHLDVGGATVGAGVLFRVNGDTQLLSAGGSIGTSGTWASNDLITITLTDAAGTGSAFNGNGSKATITIGATNYGTFTLAQQSNAYLTFSAFNYGLDQFGVGRFDNLNVTLVPEPGAALLGSFGVLALLRRRR
jgi:hypothetical protein